MNTGSSSIFANNILLKSIKSGNDMPNGNQNQNQNQSNSKSVNIFSPILIIHDKLWSNNETAPTSGLEGAATSPSGSRTEVHLFTPLQKFRHAFRELFAEFLGVFVLIMFGDGVVAQKVLSKETAGNYTTIALSWAAAVFLGYCVSAGISGAHLNPGVTLSAAVYRKFPWRKVPGYVIAQFFGGYCGALLMYGTYIESFDDFEGGRHIRTVTGDHATAGIFCTYAQPFLSTKAQVVSELVASALLQLGIFAMTDPHNAPLGAAFPFGLFVLIYAIGSSFGYQTGYAINLARDFGPRLASKTVGYSNEVFDVYHHYFWVPLVIPLIGCLLGGFVYDLFIYQGLDSPLNQRDFGVGERIEHIREFKLKDMKPDFDVERHHAASSSV